MDPVAFLLPPSDSPFGNRAWNYQIWANFNSPIWRRDCVYLEAENIVSPGRRSFKTRPWMGRDMEKAIARGQHVTLLLSTRLSAQVHARHDVLAVARSSDRRVSFTASRWRILGGAATASASVVKASRPPRDGVGAGFDEG